MLMVKKLAKEEEQMLFFFEAMMLIGLVMLLGGLFIRVKEVAWTGGWLAAAALMFFKWDVLGVFLLVLPGPFSYWYLQKIDFGKTVILLLMAAYVLLLVVSILVSVKLRKVRNEKERQRREHFVLRRMQRSSEML